MKSSKLDILCVLLSSLILLLASTSSASGRTQAVYDIINKPIVTGSGSTLSLGQVETLLRRAAEAKGWTVNRIEDGHIVAKIRVRKHYAAIDIRFGMTRYSITYSDSKLLKYDGTEIHRNYNKWIKLIDMNVEQQLLLQ